MVHFTGSTIIPNVYLKEIVLTHQCLSLIYGPNVVDLPAACLMHI